MGASRMTGKLMQTQDAVYNAAELVVRHGARCNCARCGKELIGLSMYWAWEGLPPGYRACLPEMCAGRDNGRPYCSHCLPAHREPPGFMHNLTPRQAAKLGKSSG